MIGSVGTDVSSPHGDNKKLDNVPKSADDEAGSPSKPYTSTQAIGNNNENQITSNHDRYIDSPPPVTSALVSIPTGPIISFTFSSAPIMPISTQGTRQVSGVNECQGGYTPHPRNKEDTIVGVTVLEPVENKKEKVDKNLTTGSCGNDTSGTRDRINSAQICGPCCQFTATS